MHITDTPEYWETESAYLGQAAQADRPPERSWYEKLLETAVPALVQYKTAREVQKAEIERAKAGLPPMTVAQRQALVPAARVEVGLPPQMQDMLLYGGLALGGILLFSLLKDKKGT